MKYTRGFTVIELLIVVALLTAGSILFFIQKNHIESTNRDDQRKTSINAIHHSLEEVYYKDNGAYPRAINSETLPSVAPEFLLDTNDTAIGAGTAEYHYEATNCDGDSCKSYILRTSLENEADYVKSSRQ